MADWVTVALSGGSVCVGAGLTMLGQYLADHRSQSRDREARREGFRIANYEIQRDALLELQEAVPKLSNALADISMDSKFQDLLPPQLRKITQCYQMGDLIQNYAHTLGENLELLVEAQAAANEPGTLSSERKLSMVDQLKCASKEFQDIASRFEPALQAFDEVAKLSDRIKILADRTGNDEVLSRSSGLLQMLDKWASAGNAEGSIQQVTGIDDQARQVLNAITVALKDGPFS